MEISAEWSITFPYNAILSLIPRGRERAISAGTLARTIGIDTRYLRKCIEMMRSENVPILSGNNGYWFPKDKSEAQKFKKHMLGVMGKYACLAKSVDKYLES